MAFINQTNFPKLWLIFQYIIGATRDKRLVALQNYNGEKRVLEIGCSVGNISQIFSKYKGIDFTGIDIDESALCYARKRMENFKNFRFLNISLSDLSKTEEKFDYILFSNILHHVDDAVGIELLQDIQLVLSRNATVIIMEPEKKKNNYNILYRLYYLLEQGKFRRTEDELLDLVKKSGITVKSFSSFLVTPNAIPFIKVARMTLIKATVTPLSSISNI